MFPSGDQSAPKIIQQFVLLITIYTPGYVSCISHLLMLTRIKVLLTIVVAFIATIAFFLPLRPTLLNFLGQSSTFTMSTTAVKKGEVYFLSHGVSSLSFGG